MDSKFLTYEQADELGFMFDNEPNNIIVELGLETVNPRGFWVSSLYQTSYLKIVDEKKWFLAKIKYGFRC